MRPKITVIGSVNMDLISMTTKVPLPGETIIGSGFMTQPGGKGANQAVAAARLGAEVTMIGCVGDDAFGSELLTQLKKETIFWPNVEPVTGLSTGVAQITVSKEDNSIIVIPGANDALTPEILERFENIIAESDIILLQMEIPLQTVVKAAELADKHLVRVILNPAPAQKLPSELLNLIHYLTPNEHEVMQLTNVKAGANLLDVFNEITATVVLTKGVEGVYYQNENNLVNIPSYKVKAIDTTGAGDAFNGGFAYAIATGHSLPQACKFANAVAALNVLKRGAQQGLPTLSEVEVFMQSQQEEIRH
ncbi:ribokinase [Aureibacillus halotolerans]|uniref:Ribokinase n=1 Tax=Aureibacillus halotolerans TaxID=1508390 RepID=A0A4R6TL51_9BACI|nr:ribokinase [Aureibacillus halotolerans]TDQ32162.1 ribokinase [Aureibacillus halotolerans]